VIAARLLGVLAVLCAVAEARAQSTPPVPDRAALLQQAAEAQGAGRHPEAARLYRIAAERHNSVRAFVELARLQAANGDRAAALESLGSARRLAPNSEDVLSAFAQLALSANRPLEGVQALQALTRIYPAVAQYHYLLGVGLMVLGDVPSASESLAEADRLAPDRPLTLVALGLALNNRKLFAEAKRALVRSLELDPDSAEGAAALAEAEVGLGELESAAAHAQQAIEKAPGSAAANLVSGMILMERRDYPAARDRLLRALEADPNSAKAAYQLSLVFARLGDDAAANKYIELYREKMRDFEDKLRILRSGGAER
jgi:tetratricopeptide (TPR) repeat protein